jgi:hypothetical protein
MRTLDVETREFEYQGKRFLEMLYTGCHKYVPFAGFSNKRHGGVQRFEIIIEEDNRYVVVFIKKT